jgi:hypothetical protein
MTTVTSFQIPMLVTDDHTRELLPTTMGHNDRLEKARPELPAEAGADTRSGFEPDDEWMKGAAPELRQEAMRAWFVSRYWDPANDTPYNSEEGGYLYIHGGPYDAEEELYVRFGDTCSDEAIRAVIDDVESDGITEWAPIHTEPDYDQVFELEIDTRRNPCQFFERRLAEIDALLTGAIPEALQPLLRQLLYSSLIAALEAYLADTVSYWVNADNEVLKRFVTNCEEFKQRKLSLAEIFERMDDLTKEVEGYLQQLVWHRLDKVGPLMSSAFGIEMPEIGPLMKHIAVRHDIVHRGGKTKEGKTIDVGVGAVNALRESVTVFVNALESKLEARFPTDLSGLTGDNEF